MKDLKENALEYDRNAEQTVRLEISEIIDGKPHVFYLSHIFKALTDERYFKYEMQALSDIKKIVQTENFSSAIYKAKESLWDDLIEKRVGYKERKDWKQATNVQDKVEAVSAILSAENVSYTELAQSEDVFDSEIIYDDDRLTDIILKVKFNGKQFQTVHSFKEPTVEQRDEYFAVVGGNANKNALASAAKKSQTERMCDLYDELCAASEGYTEAGVPAWHKSIACLEFFRVERVRLGKS